MWWITSSLFFIGIMVVVIKSINISNDKPTLIRKCLLWLKNCIFNDHVMQFFMGTVTTVLGVTLAIILTNNDAHLKDVDQTKSLLRTTLYDIENQYVNLESYDSLYNSLDYEEYVKNLNKNPIRHLSSFDLLLDSDRSAGNIYQPIYLQMLDTRDYINSAIIRISNDMGEDKSWYKIEMALLRLNYRFMQNNIILAFEQLQGTIKNEDDLIKNLYGNILVFQVESYKLAGYSDDVAFDKAILDMVSVRNIKSEDIVIPSFATLDNLKDWLKK